MEKTATEVFETSFLRSLQAIEAAQEKTAQIVTHSAPFAKLASTYGLIDPGVAEKVAGYGANPLDSAISKLRALRK